MPLRAKVITMLPLTFVNVERRLFKNGCRDCEGSPRSTMPLRG